MTFITPKKSNPRETSEGDSVSPSGSSRNGQLLVRECIPTGSCLSRCNPIRTARIRMLKEALLLPWIEKLPGEKRVRFVNGQIFVVQKYVGCQLIRAHISHDEGLTVLDLGNADRAVNTEREVGLAYAR